MLPSLLSCYSILFSRLSGSEVTEPTLSCLRFILLTPESPPFPTSRLQLLCGLLRFFASPPPSPIPSSNPFPPPFPSPLLLSFPSPFPSPFPSWVRPVRVCVCVYLYVCSFTLTNQVSIIRSNIRCCQSGTWSKRVTEVNGSHRGDNPLLKPTWIQIATKALPDPTITTREHPKLRGVVKRCLLSLGTNYSFYSQYRMRWQRIGVSRTTRKAESAENRKPAQTFSRRNLEL